MKIAIAGYGIEGEASYRYWNTAGNDVTIVDEKVNPTYPLPEGSKTLFGEGVFEQLNGFDLVVRTAGLSPLKIKTDGKVWSATNEFFDKCPAPIIGVTGTKGKGTTSSLIASILQSAGKTVHLLGNIGIPALEKVSKIKPYDIVVFELSSFQLWDIRKSPETAVILGIEPDHLDVHRDLDEYVHAKARIVKYQTEVDTVVYNARNVIACSIVADAKSVKIAYPSFGAAHVEDGWFYYQTIKLCPVSSLQIPGAHNIENACAAIATIWRYTQDSKVIQHGLSSFAGLPHRIKFVREIHGISFYDDSYSSAPAAAIAAIDAFSVPEIIILGGYDKGATFDELAGHIADSEQIKKVLVIGQTRERIAESLRAAGFNADKFELNDSTNFPAIIRRAYEIAEAGDAVILSPACASFDMFKNFTERGEQFIDIVEALS